MIKKNKEKNLFIFVFIIFIFFILPVIFIFAQTTLESQKAENQKAEEEKVQLEQELKELEDKIAQYEKDITKTEQEKKTLQNQIYNIKSKINQLDLQIQKGNLIIKDLTYQIKDTELSIQELEEKIEKIKGQISSLLKEINEEDKKFLFEILLSEEKLSDFFINLTSLESLHYKNQEYLKSIKELKSNLENQKQKLDEEKTDLSRTVKVQTLQKQQSEEARKEQEKLLKMTEAQYQKYLQEKQALEKRANEIRNRIYQLTLPGLEVPKTNKELYELAKWAGDVTGGVRPALILGLLELESALGTNVGQCNCSGQTRCNHPELTYKTVMPKSQWASFETITKELGLNANTTPVSCYVSGGNVQMGGAMGPAQFMPNTWLNLGYKQRVESITGIRPANPWRAKDAFLAAAIYLSDWGAQTKNRQKEEGAVLAYLCGTSTLTPTCARAGGEWYKKTVMEKADQWQSWINQGVF